MSSVIFEHQHVAAAMIRMPRRISVFRTTSKN